MFRARIYFRMNPPLVELLIVHLRPAMLTAFDRPAWLGISALLDLPDLHAMVALPVIAGPESFAPAGMDQSVG
jgi:hypothetical protein